jgi:hypothetical protein
MLIVALTPFSFFFASDPDFGESSSLAAGRKQARVSLGALEAELRAESEEWRKLCAAL